MWIGMKMLQMITVNYTFGDQEFFPFLVQTAELILCNHSLTNGWTIEIMNQMVQPIALETVILMININIYSVVNQWLDDRNYEPDGPAVCNHR